MLETIPLSQRPGEGWPLCREALAEIAGGRFAKEEWTVRVRQALDSGESLGVLALEGPELIGIATWSRIPLPTRRVSLLYRWERARRATAPIDGLHPLVHRSRVVRFWVDFDPPEPD